MALMKSDSAATDIFFVIDGQKLEAQAYFLVASIMEHMRGKGQFYAYKRSNAELPPQLRSFLEEGEVELRDLPPASPDLWREAYPIGNKLLAAIDDRPGSVQVFIDTDVVFNTAVDFRTELGTDSVAAVLSDYRSSLHSTAEWKPIFDFYEIEAPAERPGTLKRPWLDYPPYYNSGVVLFRKLAADGKTAIANEWLRLASELDRCVLLGDARVNLDQLSLSVIDQTTSLSLRRLPNRLNFNVQAWGDAGKDNCNIAHYHVFGALWKARTVGSEACVNLERRIGKARFSQFVSDYRKWIRPRMMRQLLRNTNTSE